MMMRLYERDSRADGGRARRGDVLTAGNNVQILRSMKLGVSLYHYDDRGTGAQKCSMFKFIYMTRDTIHDRHLCLTALFCCRVGFVATISAAWCNDRGSSRSARP